MNEAANLILSYMTLICSFVHENALSSYLKDISLVLDYSYHLSGATNIDGEWSSAGFNIAGVVIGWIVTICSLSLNTAPEDLLQGRQRSSQKQNPK